MPDDTINDNNCIKIFNSDTWELQDCPGCSFKKMFHLKMAIYFIGFFIFKTI